MTWTLSDSVFCVGVAIGLTGIGLLSIPAALIAGGATTVFVVLKVDRKLRG